MYESGSQRKPMTGFRPTNDPARPNMDCERLRLSAMYEPLEAYGRPETLQLMTDGQEHSRSTQGGHLP